MKNLALVIGMILVSLPAFAQKRSDFQGPKYKNYKYWKHNVTPTVVLTTNAKKSLKGPKFKNHKPWKDTAEETIKTEVQLQSRRPKVTGPKYKNYKPWKNNNK